MPDDAIPPLLGLSQRLPPANLQAEQGLLGAILANNRAFEAAAFLEPAHFADPIHGRLFAEIRQRLGAGRPVDAVTLAGELQSAGILDEVGGTKYLADLLTALVSPRFAPEYARAVRDTWLRRQVIDIAEGAVNAAFAAPDLARPGDTLVSEAIDRLLRLGEEATAGTTGPVTLAAALTQAVDRADAAQRGEHGAARLDTGVRTFDALWQGLWPGELYYLMARSRTGKTSAMALIARNVAARLLAEAEQAGREPEHVHVLSLEMTAESYGVINLAATTPFTADEIKAGRVRDWNKLREAQAALSRLPIVVDDEGGMTVSQVVTRARVVARTRRTRLLLIDYGELIRRGRDEARMGLPEWIPLLGYRLKELSKALRIPIVALRQINKSRDTADSARPTLTDLPYDGGQAADAVFALHRPELAINEETAPSSTRQATMRGGDKGGDADRAWIDRRERAQGVAEFGALKRRFGPTGWRQMRFDGPRMLFVDPESEDGGPLGDEPPPHDRYWDR